MARRAPTPPQDLSPELVPVWRAYWKSEDLGWDTVLDLQLVIRLFLAYERVSSANTALDTFTRLSAELRLLEDRLGLNPKSRANGGKVSALEPLEAL